jgi:hypothetical protein
LHLVRIAQVTAGALICLAAFDASANGTDKSREAGSERVTYEVAPTFIVIREVPPPLIVVKEIAPPEIVVKEIAPPIVIRKRASRYASHGPAPSVDRVVSEIPDLATFLDRLMLAESGGRDAATNPRSSALGPFQFIKSTFLDVARRNFPKDTGQLSDKEVLALRTARDFARAAAQAYTLENAAYLKSLGHEPTWPHLRLAFLLGPSGACRVLEAAPETPLTRLLPPSVLSANPFLAGMTATDLVAKSARDISGDRPKAAVPEASSVARARPPT